MTQYSDLFTPPVPTDTIPAPVSISFASDLIGDIAALEPQDIAVFKLAFDNFELEELELYRRNIREIAKLILAYKRAALAKNRAYKRSLIATDEYKAMRVARRRKQRAAKRELVKAGKSPDVIVIDVEGG